MLTSFDSSSKWTLDNIKELNQSLEQLVKSNNVRQNPNNTRSEALQQIPQAQPGMVQPGMQPGIGQPAMGQMQPGMGVG
jgi:hypothetical protein